MAGRFADRVFTVLAELICAVAFSRHAKTLPRFVSRGGDTNHPRGGGRGLPASAVHPRSAHSPRSL